MRYELTRRLPLPLNGRLETPLSRILEKRCNQPVFVPFRSPSFPHFLPRDGVEDDGAVSLRAYIRCAVYHRVFLFFFLFFFFPQRIILIVARHSFVFNYVRIF